jgi:hypothetical protein
MTTLGSVRKTLEESRVVIAQNLTSSLGFQGDPQLLVIDELHFVLRPAAITLDLGKTLRGNVMEADRQLLVEQQETLGALKEERTTEALSGRPAVTVRRYEFPPINSIPTRDLLKAMHGIYAADEYTVTLCEEVCKLTFYYNSDPEAGPQVFRSSLEEPVAQSLLSWAELLLESRRTTNLHSQRHERLYKDFAGSPYLELVLHNLRQMILHQLASPGLGFENMDGNPFMLQFFLLFTTQRESDQAGLLSHTLRYFPLEAERKRLMARDVNAEIARRLAAKSLRLNPAQSPSEFSRNYPWRASKSLVGYAYETGASRYFERWQEEPITQGGEDNDRDIATTIMQTVRDDSPHQFTIPLFANREKIGAMIINTKNVISKAGRLLSIRCARGAGLPLEMALNMDDQVNKITAKLTQVRTYKHVLSSLLHEEDGYTTLLGKFCDSVYNPSADNPVKRWEAPVRHIIRDRIQLIHEFNLSSTGLGTGVVDPIRNIPASAIFHNLPKLSDTTIEQLNTSVTILKEVFPQAKILRTKVSIEEQNPVRQTVPAVKTIVLRRIMGNLLRNTAKSGQEVPDPYLEFSFNEVKQLGRSYLEIVAVDNCGGFKAGVPLGPISFEIWSNHLNELEKRERTVTVHGMGFLTLLKYASSTNGSFRIENTEDEQGMTGARITLRIGLPDRTESA